MQAKALILYTVFLFSVQVTAEVGFDVQYIEVGGHKLKVEIAKTNKQKSHGLMFRKKLNSNSGMLFDFNKEERLKFWMKNTFIPLSIGFFNSKKVLVDIQDMQPMTSLMQVEVKTYQSKRPAQYALEVNQGWFKKHNVSIGDKFKFLK